LKRKRVAIQLQPVSGRLHEKMIPDDWGATWWSGPSG